MRNKFAPNNYQSEIVDPDVEYIREWIEYGRGSIEEYELSLQGLLDPEREIEIMAQREAVMSVYEDPFIADHD